MNWTRRLPSASLATKPPMRPMIPKLAVDQRRSLSKIRSTFSRRASAFSKVWTTDLHVAASMPPTQVAMPIVDRWLDQAPERLHLLADALVHKAVQGDAQASAVREWRRSLAELRTATNGFNSDGIPVAIEGLLTLAAYIEATATVGDAELPVHQLLRVARLSALVGGAAGVVLAVVLQTVIGALTIFYSLLVVTLFIPIVGGLAVRRATSREALASIVAGIGTLFVVRFFVTPTLPRLDPTLTGILAGAVAFGLSSLAPRSSASRTRA